MKTLSIALIIFALVLIPGCKQSKQSSSDIWNLAVARKSDLRLSVYVTAQTVEQMFTTETGRREVVSLLRCNGITKVYMEVYRSGLVISPEVIRSSVLFLKENRFEVVGGIATVPGGDFGVPQKGPLDWFNWQNPKTQNDLRKVMEDSAPFFDTFIVDDFLCTADTSLESKSAKGGRSWSEYRRSLLTELSQSVFIKPAKEKNPAIKIIIKYPQWYDRFHLFGYDVVSEPKLFDGVWVGTETRGQFTQRFGFVQPYEGFINFRWISTLAGNKIGGAWFDHGDCTDNDFIEQAYQSVLAGAKELVIFNFDSFVTGHPGHHLLRQDFEKLAGLAETIAKNPVQGVVGYKPPNSDAGGDLYLLDYIGMLGVSLVPDSKYPENAKVIFLPTQAATDHDMLAKIMKSLDNGAKIIMTTGFIANANCGEKLAQLAQIKWPLPRVQSVAETIISEGNPQKLKFPLNMDYQIIPDGADILLQTADPANNPFLIQNQSRTVFVLNSHTFSQKDFDEVGEVLLCPRQLGLLELPKPWVNTIRSAFHSVDEPVIDAPSRVSMQQLSNRSFIIHNYNQENTNVNIRLPQAAEYVDGFSGKPIPTEGKEIKLRMAPRSSIWVRINNK
ncbi:MAG: hypothetical protein Q7T72_14890 [Bacteroidales bacterium]|nr:hypothetical protein [Bacteroidales bacterium]